MIDRIERIIKISIIIPTYNRADIIGNTLESIKAQTYENWECIIVDDYSTDNTCTIVDGFINSDFRFKYYINERKKGAQGARNTGLFKSRAEWVFFFDSDNLLHHDCLLELVSAIKDNVDVVQCYSRVIDVTTGEVKKLFKWRNFGNIQNRLFAGETYVDFNHAIIRKSKVVELGGLDENCPSMQEWDTHLRLSRTACYYTVEKVLVDYFVGAKDAISSDNKKAITGRLYNLEKFLCDWKKNKAGLFRFVYLYSKMISNNQDVQFKNECFKKLDELVPMRKLYVSLGYVVNKYLGIKKAIKG